MRFYVICATPRSGSNFLCRELARHSGLGQPGEFFNFHEPLFRYARELEAETFDGYIDRLLAQRSSDNEIFGWKAFWFDFVFLRDLAGKLDRFRPLEYIYLHRQDEQAQAVSFAYAAASKAWSSDHPSEIVPDYNRDDIDRALRDVRWNCQGWEDYFRANSIEPLRIDYDSMVGDPDTVLRQIAERIGRPLRLPSPRQDLQPLQAQRESGKAQWLIRYRQEQAAARNAQQQTGASLLDG